MNLIDFLHTPVARALGWTLLHALWQGFAIVLSAAVVLHLLRGQSSTLRYQISVLTLMSQLLASAVTFFWYYTAAVNLRVNPVSNTLTPPFPARWQAVTQTLGYQPLPWHQQMQQFLETHLSQFVLIYLIGVAVFGLRLIGGWIYLQQLSRTAVQPALATWAELTSRLRSSLAIKVVIQVRESARIAVPMVVGVLKPVLLLPFGLATHLSIREIEAVLAHELAHIKRHDYGVNLLQSVIEVLYFFHPALWWLSARVREEREHCCDDLAVLACEGNARLLAQALARIEELRLTQTGAPSLAMAFATNQQQLLHRVRRILGVQTRPVVSNASLGGLTLATLLLMSVSVYAVQQDEPKQSKKPRPTHSTRRHKTDKGTEFSVSDDRKIDNIVWKGQKLPAARVARLQRQLDQVMAGQLSLDKIPQSDRDILLTIIETNHSFKEGMAGLGEGLAQIDYNTIMKTAFEAANNAGTFPVNVDAVLKEVEKIDYNSIIGPAMESVSLSKIAVDSLIDPQSENLGRLQSLLHNQDSLATLQEINRSKTAALQAQARSQEFAVEAIERKIERLERQRSVLEQKRFFETSSQQQIILKSGVARTDSARTALLKQIDTGEQAIQATESAIEKLNQQLIDVQGELEKVQKPLRDTEEQIRKLSYSGYQNYARLNYADDGLAPPARPAIPARPPKPAHVIIPGDIVRPATPAAPRRLKGKIAPMPAVPANVAPVIPSVPAHPPVARPAPTPKVAPVPKLDK